MSSMRATVLALDGPWLLAKVLQRAPKFWPADAAVRMSTGVRIAPSNGKRWVAADETRLR
jgi:hypothetical protein